MEHKLWILSCLLFLLTTEKDKEDSDEGKVKWGDRENIFTKKKNTKIQSCESLSKQIFYPERKITIPYIFLKITYFQKYFNLINKKEKNVIKSAWNFIRSVYFNLYFIRLLCLSKIFQFKFFFSLTWILWIRKILIEKFYLMKNVMNAIMQRIWSNDKYICPEKFNKKHDCM